MSTTTELDKRETIITFDFIVNSMERISPTSNRHVGGREKSQKNKQNINYKHKRKQRIDDP
jgi:hypothetical protein